MHDWPLRWSQTVNDTTATVATLFCGSMQGFDDGTEPLETTNNTWENRGKDTTRTISDIYKPMNRKDDKKADEVKDEPMENVAESAKERPKEASETADDDDDELDVRFHVFTVSFVVYVGDSN